MQCGDITRAAVSQRVVKVAVSKFQIKVIVYIGIITYWGKNLICNPANVVMGCKSALRKEIHKSLVIYLKKCVQCSPTARK